MAASEDELDALSKQVAALQRELEEARQKASELERAKSGAGGEVPELPGAISEFEETLRRLVQRTAMIVQAEKCVIMVLDREADELVARAPAFGMTDLEVKSYRVESGRGISGQVYSTGQPYILTNASEDTRAVAERLPALRIRNGITVPLIVETRDDDNRLVEQVRIGVLHCFNKRYNAAFNDEDGHLLQRLSRNAASVIANAQMYQEVVQEKQKLVHTLESLTAGLILINQHGRISQINAQARSMFGIIDGQDPIHKPFDAVIKHEGCLSILRQKIEEANNPKPLSEEDDPRKPDEIIITDEEGNQYVYQVHAASVRDDDNQPFGIVVIFNDITDLRAVERMKTEFVSIVSHELRTPLTPMKGFIQTLLQDENEEVYDRELRREFYNIIHDNVDRLSRLINDLLNVSRIEKGAGLEFNWAEVDLRTSVEAAVAMQKGQSNSSKHQLLVDFDPEHIVAETDPDLFQNILHNLLSNAIKYAPDGGEVRVIGRLEPATAEHPETVVIGVKDQGLGLSESELKKVGTLFNRAKSARGKQGTGIGLYLVTAIVKGHHGVLKPESDGHGKGATFWFRFPRKQLKPAGAEQNASA